MNLPESIRVGHLRLAVVALSPAEVDASGKRGEFDEQRSRVAVLVEDVAVEVIAETLLHEVLHACCAVANTYVSPAVEERFVRAVAPVLLMTMRDNPRLFGDLIAAVS